MAEDLIAPAPPEPPEPDAVPSPPAERHPMAHRFRLITASLAVIAVCALVIAGGLAATKTDSQTAQAWSDWQPTSSGEAAIQQIADHVGPSYKGLDGKQLVSVTGGALKVADLPVHIALRGVNPNGDISLVRGSGVLFTLCGLGPHCSITDGKPSPERMLLLRREALELALYTLKYEEGADNVAVLMPPRPGERTVKSPTGQTTVTGNQGTAMLFERKRLQSQLSTPLAESLPTEVPTIKTIASSPDGTFVNKLTAPSIFLVSIVQGQDATAYLVLDPLKKTK